jgi:diadenosine tetraphosphatase ApaH/serine/threonine PP2A family protein phosphatase
LKVFVCGDIHGNVRSLDAVLEIYRRVYPCTFLFLGDCVGYGPHPDACLERILNLPRAHLLMGNHDSALFNHDERVHMNDLAVQALFWSEKMIRERFEDVIHERFRVEFEGDGYRAAHASPVRPKEWPYIFTTLDANEVFYERDFFVCFVGHTHVQTVFSFRDGEMRPEEGFQYDLDPEDRYIINPGSVGQPRDLDPRAACCVFDPEEKMVTFFRKEYDVAAEVEDFFKAGLPEYLGRRLLEGM